MTDDTDPTVPVDEPLPDEETAPESPDSEPIEDPEAETAAGTEASDG